ncbi:MAG: valine--tRNA ligase, partial [Planctomycetota bacterium]
DVIVRWQRMKGRDVLWLPGTDHAGIATQAVVERELWKNKKVKRVDLGRDKFLQEVWAWKEEHGNAILRQFRELGCSCDWSRTAFTMDEKLSRAVRVAFVKLWEKGLIYRGHRMVNWDCTLRSAIGDDEILDVETKGHLWYFRYPYAEGSGHVTVATTRPETMLGDTGVAVHPDDARYGDLVGKHVILPLMDRRIPVVADETVDPDFGTGAVKVTPGHDPADYERGERHRLEVINLFNLDGTLTESAGSYQGLGRDEARKRVLADLEAQGLLEKVEDHVLRIPVSERSKDIIEPLVSEQWFVKMKPLAGPAIRAVKDGSLRFVPARWTKVYLAWLENVRDWCISRQLWWGHQMPVWYDEDDVPVASVEELEIGAPHPKTGKPIVRQDDDVLDTWASSWLWPFSTLGWPEKTPDLKRYYPTQYLATAREIIYLWVARMVMAGYEFCGASPFDTVYINATVLDEIGRRMSKSLGNGIDPRDMIEQYGADAVRYTLCLLATEGQDVKLAATKFELGRNFMNKIWNAARFVLSSVPDEAREAAPGDTLPDRWILSRLSATTAEVTDALDHYRFNEAAQALYRFVWDDYCDWYLEASKERLRDKDLACGGTLLTVLRAMVRLLQPFAPYISAELADRLGEERDAALLGWPGADGRDSAAEAEMTRLQDVIRAVRRIRNENRLQERVPVRAVVKTAGPDLLLAHEALIRQLARLESLEAGPDVVKPGASGHEVLGDDEVFVPLEGLVDLAAEQSRRQKEIEKQRRFLGSIEAKLGNENFVSRAKPEVVQRERDRAEEVREKIARLEQTLKDLA